MPEIPSRAAAQPKICGRIGFTFNTKKVNNLKTLASQGHKGMYPAQKNRGWS